MVRVPRDVTSPGTAAPSGLARILSSPRAHRRLFWIGGGVFVVGLAAFLSLVVIHGHGIQNAPHNNQPVKISKLESTVKADPTAFKVARVFLETAVVRKNLDASWNLVAPSLKNGFTRKQWDTGNNTVVPYPAVNASTAGLTVIHSWKNSLYVSLELLPKRGSGVKPAGFNLELTKIHGRWLVDYFEDSYNFPTPYNGGGV